MRSSAYALISSVLMALPAFADGEGFLRFVFDSQVLDLPPEAIQRVQVIKDYSAQDALDVTVTPDWHDAVSSLTQNPQGRVISIYICGALVAEPTLQDRISAGRFFVVGDPEMVHQAARFLTAKSCTAVPGS